MNLIIKKIDDDLGISNIFDRNNNFFSIGFFKSKNQLFIDFYQYINGDRVKNSELSCKLKIDNNINDNILSIINDISLYKYNSIEILEVKK